MANRTTRPDLSRSLSTQPYRTTTTAQRIARTIRAIDDGRAITLQPITRVLSPRTRALLRALKGGQQ